MKKEDKYVKSNRTFPVGNTVLMLLCVLAQVGLILFAVLHQPQPKDLIHQYIVDVTPQPDGSLNVIYAFRWEALDDSEPLTWVEIGMPNRNFTIDPVSISDTVQSFERYVNEDYVAVRLYFYDSYLGGETVEFSFKVNQKNMLCENEEGYFYEFIPCWFNEIAVEQYEFTWHVDDAPDYVRQGRLDYGQYEKLFVQYGPDDFAGCDTVGYAPFDSDGAYDGLAEDKTMTIVACCLIAGFLVLLEIYIIDSYVSYGRGRGFLTGYGHHVHTYGRSNPYYIRARDKHLAANRSNGGGRSGGCACACACACAGGGRAGCSQKDTFGKKTVEKSHQNY